MDATCAGLGDPKQSQVVNLGWMLLVPCLGLIEVNYCFFDRIYQVVKNEPRTGIHMEKQFEWTCKLGVAESVRISKVDQIVIARLVEFQIQHLLPAL